MPQRRIRSDHPVVELRRARVFKARKYHECGWVHPERCVGIWPKHIYLRISETRLPVCSACAGITPEDITDAE